MFSYGFIYSQIFLPLKQGLCIAIHCNYVCTLVVYLTNILLIICFINSLNAPVKGTVKTTWRHAVSPRAIFSNSELFLDQLVAAEKCMWNTRDHRRVTVFANTAPGADWSASSTNPRGRRNSGDSPCKSGPDTWPYLQFQARRLVAGNDGPWRHSPGVPEKGESPTHAFFLILG